MPSIPPIPDNAFFTVQDLGGASLGGGPHSLSSAKTYATNIMGEKIDLGPYLVERIKKHAVGSDEITFNLVVEPRMDVVAGTFDWNSVDCSEYFWWHKAKQSGSSSPLAFVYLRDSTGAASATDPTGAKSTANPQITVHIPQVPDSPGVPGESDTILQYTIEIRGSYYLIDFAGGGTISLGTSLA